MFRHQSRLPNGLRVEHQTLDNEMEIYLIAFPNTRTISVQSWFRIGSYHEKLDPRLHRTGLAHFFEHLMFRGTHRFPDGSYDKLLTKAGAIDINASTWLDRTHYYATIPSSALDLILKLESNRLTDLKLTKNIFEKERGAVLGEYAIGKDDPELVLFELLYSRSFSYHPYQYSPMGTELEIRSFTLEDAHYLYQTYYQPSNLTLCLAGNIPKDVMKRIERNFGKLKGKPVPQLGNVNQEPAQTQSQEVSLEHPNLNRALTIFSYHSPAKNHVDHAVLSVLLYLLVMGKGALLYPRLVDSGLVIQLDGGIDEFKDPGLLSVSFLLQKDTKSVQVKEIFDRVLDQIENNQIELSAQLTRVKNLFLYDFYEQFEESSTTGIALGEALMSYSDIFLPFKQIEIVEQVTPNQIQHAIRKYLRPTQRTVVYGIPPEKSGND